MMRIATRHLPVATVDATLQCRLQHIVAIDQFRIVVAVANKACAAYCATDCAAAKTN